MEKLKTILGYLTLAVIFSVCYYFGRKIIFGTNHESRSYSNTEYSYENKTQYHTKTCTHCGKQFETSSSVKRLCGDCEFWQNGLKKARHDWIKDNPAEAKRRGIDELY